MTAHEKAVLDLTDALDAYHIALSNWVDAHEELRQRQIEYHGKDMSFSQIKNLTVDELNDEQQARHRLTGALLLILVRFDHMTHSKKEEQL